MLSCVNDEGFTRNSILRVKIPDERVILSTGVVNLEIGKHVRSKQRLDKAALLADLRQKIARREVHDRDPAALCFRQPLRLGVPTVDEMLPREGLALSAVHEVQAAQDGAALAFAAHLAARRAKDGGMVLWGMTGLGLYGPGLASFGITPERLLLVRGRSERELLWAVEEGLKCRSLAAVVAEVRRIDLKQSRRLQLAAEKHGVTAIVLRPPESRLEASAAATRWRLSAVPAVDGRFRCKAELLRCRSGGEGEWILDWNDATGAFDLAPPLVGGAAEPAAAQA